MNGESVPVSIQVLDKEYIVSCPPEERDALLESVKELNDRMRRLRDGGKILGAERMAVMTALNVIHECADLRRERDRLTAAVRDDVRRLEEKLQNAVGRRRPMEAVD